MKLLYRLFKLDPEKRENVIAVTSGLGIVVNVFIAAAKVIIGLITASIAIMSEGVNNATDALSSLLTLVGTKLAGRHPDKKHPFGYGRIEYLVGLVIAVLILVSGVEMLISSIELVFNPEPLDTSSLTLSLIIVGVSAVIKFFLGIYTVNMGRKTGSSALEGVGLECRNDSFVSIVTILSIVIYLVFDGVSIDAYVGILMSAIIIKAGVEVLLDTISEILGRPGEKELALKIYKEIRKTKEVLNAADMMLHNYGPDAYSGSVNLELDHNLTVGEAYEVLHELQLRIMHEEHVTMVFGIYAVDNDHDYVRKLRKTVAKFVSDTDHVHSFHAVYLDPHSNRLYCDLIVDYDLRDYDVLKADFKSYMAGFYPDKEIMLTVETEFV